VTHTTTRTYPGDDHTSTTLGSRVSVPLEGFELLMERMHLAVTHSGAEHLPARVQFHDQRHAAGARQIQELGEYRGCVWVGGQRPGGCVMQAGA
jgi:hypothetical protein